MINAITTAIDSLQGHNEYVYAVVIVVALVVALIQRRRNKRMKKEW